MGFLLLTPDRLPIDEKEVFPMQRTPFSTLRKALKGIRARLTHETLLFVLVFTAGFLAGRAQMLDELRPGGTAIIMAVGWTGLPLLPAVLGSVLGMVSLGEAFPLQLIAPALLLFTAIFILRICRRDIGLRFSLVFLALARLIVVPFGDALAYDTAVYLLETGLSLVLCYAFGSAVQILQRKRNPFDGGNLITVALALGALLGGLPSFGGTWFSVPLLVLSFLVLTAARLRGAAFGAAMGLSMGSILAISGQIHPTAIGALGICGLLAGSMAELGRWGPSLGFFLGTVVSGFYFGQQPFAMVPLFSLLPAIALAITLPNRLWQHLIHAMAPPKAIGLDEALPMENIRRMTVDRLERFEDCFSELARVFSTASDGNQGAVWEEVAPVLELVAGDACRGCAESARCWKTEFFTTYSHFLTALSSPRLSGNLLESDFPEEFRKSCQHMDRVLTSLTSAFGLYRARTSALRRIEDSRSLVTKQLTGVAGVVGQLAQQVNLDIRLRTDRQKLIGDILRANGVRVRTVTVQEDFEERMSVFLTTRPCGGKRHCVGMYTHALSTALGRPMRCNSQGCSANQDVCRLQFAEMRAMRARSVALQRAASGTVCGDGWLSRPVGEHAHLLAISDGMGIGAKASAESSATLRLLERFYAAGFSEEVVFQTINAILMLRSGTEMYATVDLCHINLVDGTAHFVKVGAAPTYILREGQVHTIAVPSLPIGILDQVRPATLRRTLNEGDLIVMASDGVAGDGEWLEEALPALAGLQPDELVRRIMEMAQARGTAPDDMTVLATTIRSPHPATSQALKRQKTLRWKARVASEV